MENNKRDFNSENKRGNFNSAKKAKEVNSEKKKPSLLAPVTKVFRSLSLSVNLTIHTLYLIYLIYAIQADIGIQVINIILAIVTALFMIVYFILRLSSKQSKEKIRLVKRYYKNFKLATKIVSSVTAIYAIIVAIDAVNPFGLIISFIGTVFLVIKIMVELVLHYIKKKFGEIKTNIKARFARQNEERKDEEGNIRDDFFKDDKRRVHRKRRKNKINDLDDIIIPVEDCILSDVEDV